MERFLNEKALQRSKTRVRSVTRFLYFLAGLVLILFVALCLMTRTGNAQATLYLAMAVTILGGLAVLALWMFALEPAKAENRLYS